MSNLFLPEINFDEVPNLNMARAGYWSFNNVSTIEYRFIQAFSPDECLQIIKLGNIFHSDQSKTGADTSEAKGFSEIRKSMNSWIPPCEISHPLYVKLQQIILEINKHYEFDIHSMENLQFTEYSDRYQGNYTKHIDKFPNEAQPNNHRKLSFSIQLSDPSTYEGGELLIHNSEHPIVANKQLGCINFFPSYVMHEVTPVTKGTRYSLVGWISGPKFK